MSIDAHLTYELSSDSESDELYYSDSDETEPNLNYLQLDDSLINAKSIIRPQELANDSKTKFINENIQTNCCLVDKNRVSFERFHTKTFQTFNYLNQRFEKALKALKCDQKLSREHVSH
jgi:hypothetical protein